MKSRPGRLSVVATPIGNLEDLSPRALATLRRASAIYCEDTRVTAKIAARFGISAPRISCHEHNEARRAGEVVGRLRAGEDLALVCDAGTPAISDPGARIVAEAARAGLTVLAVPGPSAVTAALSISGLPAVPHVFLGFLPARAGERRKFLREYASRPETLVYLEAPHRLARSLGDAAETLGPRPAIVGRELTKVHEEVLRGTLSEISRTVASRASVRGECVVVVAGSDEEAPPEKEDWRVAAARETAAGGRMRQIASSLAKRFGVPSREIYQWLTAQKHAIRRS